MADPNDVIAARAEAALLAAMDRAQDAFVEGRMDRHPRPGRLVHYTNWRGLVGILHERVLWATTTRAPDGTPYLDDKTEGIHARSVLSEVCRGRQTGFVELPGTPEEWAAYIAALLGPFLDQPLPSTSVACLTTLEDDQGQWEQYGAGGEGFALVFDGHNLDLEDRVHLERVEYSHDEQVAALDELLSVVSEEVAAHAPANLTDVDALLFANAGRSAVLGTAAVAAAIYKEWRWSPQKEWRIVVIAGDERDSPAPRFTGDAEFVGPVGAQRPHHDVALRRDRILPLLAIYVGHKVDFADAEPRVRQLLEECGCSPGVPVLQSRVPRP